MQRGHYTLVTLNNRTYFAEIYDSPVELKVDWVAGPEMENPADFNHDGAIDAADAAILFDRWGESQLGDLNGDGLVDAADAAILFASWTGDS